MRKVEGEEEEDEDEEEELDHCFPLRLYLQQFLPGPLLIVSTLPV